MICDAYAENNGNYYIANPPKDSFIHEIREYTTEHLREKCSFMVQFHNVGIIQARTLNEPNPIILKALENAGLQNKTLHPGSRKPKK